MSDRDSDGKFAKGNKGGPGRPSRAVEVAREFGRIGIVIDAVSDDDFREIIDKAVEQAKAGDARAREWIVSLLVAKNLEQIKKWKTEANFFEGVSLVLDDLQEVDSQSELEPA